MTANVCIYEINLQRIIDYQHLPVSQIQLSTLVFKRLKNISLSNSLYFLEHKCATQRKLNYYSVGEYINIFLLLTTNKKALPYAEFFCTFTNVCCYMEK